MEGALKVEPAPGDPEFLSDFADSIVHSLAEKQCIIIIKFLDCVIRKKDFTFRDEDLISNTRI